MDIKEALDRIFEEATHQQEALINIYKLFLPEWDEIEQINGFPSCSDEMWTYICKKFFALDKKCHPNCLAGGAWLNHGFSGNHNLTGFDNIDLSTCQVIRKS